MHSKSLVLELLYLWIIEMFEPRFSTRIASLEIRIARMSLGSTGIWWYALITSIVENMFFPWSICEKSSICGIGYIYPEQFLRWVCCSPRRGVILRLSFVQCAVHMAMGCLMVELFLFLAWVQIQFLLISSSLVSGVVVYWMLGGRGGLDVVVMLCLSCFSSIPAGLVNSGYSLRISWYFEFFYIEFTSTISLPTLLPFAVRCVVLSITSLRREPTSRP